uniref:DUF772 domain-containing protein n=1 Tax=Globodera pallida TaxID=36090 RepID=A0A183BM82_GLOPA
MVESMELLLSEQAERFSGTFFYCMDDAVCTKFGEFCAPLVRAIGHRMGPPVTSQWATLLKLYIEQCIRCLCGWEVTGGGDFSASALRFLFGCAIGFSGRRMALILKHRPGKEGMAGWTERTTDWIRTEMIEGGSGGGEVDEGQRKRGGEDESKTTRRMG